MTGGVSVNGRDYSRWSGAPPELFSPERKEDVGAVSPRVGVVTIRGRKTANRTLFGRPRCLLHAGNPGRTSAPEVRAPKRQGEGGDRPEPRLEPGLDDRRPRPRGRAGPGRPPSAGARDGEERRGSRRAPGAGK